MKYFVTGASGFIGSKVCAELIASGHQVVGLARSEDSAKKLRDMGVEPLMGSLDDIAVLQKAAKDSDGVVHCGYIHDFSKFVECAAIDGRVITALGEALEGSNKPLVISSGVMLVNKPPGEVSTEADVGATEGFGAPRAQNEAVLLSFNARGVRGSAIRLPPTTHGDGDKGFMTQIINLHRDAKCAAYAGEFVSCACACRK
jgi:nucleoside-diphosphate-sugar epimerase